MNTPDPEPRDHDRPSIGGTARLNAALAALQGELPTFARDDQREVTVEHKDGSSHSYRYVTLDTIMGVVGPLMAKHGLSFSAMPGYNDQGDGKIGMGLRYRLAHSSGEEIGGLFPLTVEEGRTSRIQAMGSAITYARRYCLASVLGIASEQDDDGMAAILAEDGATARRAPATVRKTSGRAKARPAPSGAPPDLPGGDVGAGAPTQGAMSHLFGLLGQLGITAKERRLAAASQTLGRDITSFSELTSDDVRLLTTEANQRLGRAGQPPADSASAETSDDRD